MQRLEVSGAVRPLYGSLVVKRLNWKPVDQYSRNYVWTFVPSASNFVTNSRPNDLAHKDNSDELERKTVMPSLLVITILMSDLSHIPSRFFFSRIIYINGQWPVPAGCNRSSVIIDNNRRLPWLPVSVVMYFLPSPRLPTWVVCLFPNFYSVSMQ